MSKSILIADSDLAFKKELVAKQITHLEFKFVDNGKDAQLQIYKDQFDSVVINIDLKNNSGIEVLRYLKFNTSAIKTILIFDSKEVFDKYSSLKKDFQKMGVNDIFIKPFSLDVFHQSIEGDVQYAEWKNSLKNSIQVNRDSDNLENEIAFDVSDDEFTKIPISYLLSGNTCVFDCFLRITRNKYLKILHKNSYLGPDRLKHYSENTSHLYFRTKERVQFISYFNNILHKIAKNNKYSPDQKIELSKDLLEKYVEETYAKGMSPSLMKEGISLTKNMFQIIENTPALSTFLREYKVIEPNSHTHLFLVTFYAMGICKKLEWSSDSTIQKVAFGGILHDIGKLKLPQDLMTCPFDKMNLAQQEIYKEHPRIGANMLANIPNLHESVRQIVFQHHESQDKEGFPSGISGIRIFPLAKVISLADYFTNLIINEKLSPINALKQFIPHKKQTKKFDPDIIKALIKCFITKKSNNNQISTKVKTKIRR